VAILGGIDMHFLCTSDEDELRSYIDNVIDICAVGGGYALGSGNTVSNYVPLRNYYAMLDQGRKKGVYKI
jgi:uroporphyrinogen decarboxylase